jgi:hypothetical protein
MRASYGPKSGPYAGSRASSPGEQAAACDYRKTRALGYAPYRLDLVCPEVADGEAFGEGVLGV